MISTADDFIARLDSDGLEEWKAMLQDCMGKNDWTALIMHRMCIWITTARSLFIYLIIANTLAAELRKRKSKLLKVSVNVPIEYSALHFFHLIVLPLILAQRRVRLRS